MEQEVVGREAEGEGVGEKGGVGWVDKEIITNIHIKVKYLDTC